LDTRRFRDTLRRFGTGVTVMTAGDPVDTAGGLPTIEYHGMTANAFMSVSLAPPLVAVGVAIAARMHAFLQRASGYGVSVLAEGQEPLARHFSGRPQPGIVVELDWFEDIPLLRGAVAQLACRIVAAHRTGDHSIFIGEVRSAAWREGTPLLFFDGQLYAMEARPIRSEPVPLPLEVTTSRGLIVDPGQLTIDDP
jgi:flavin reductase (DIM6/NTAB) family NADH-FMN oxidoreductase RutF